MINKRFLCRLRQDPADLEALGEAIKLHEQLQSERDTIEGMISPIQDQFAILDKNEVPIPDEVIRNFSIISLTKAHISRLVPILVMFY